MNSGDNGIFWVAEEYCVGGANSRYSNVDESISIKEFLKKTSLGYLKDDYSRVMDEYGYVDALIRDEVFPPGFSPQRTSEIRVQLLRIEREVIRKGLDISELKNHFFSHYETPTMRELLQMNSWGWVGYWYDTVALSVRTAIKKLHFTVPTEEDELMNFCFWSRGDCWSGGNRGYAFHKWDGEVMEILSKAKNDGRTCLVGIVK